MGLFSRLKKAFSLPESEESQAPSAASEATSSAASAASVAGSTVGSATSTVESQAPVSSATPTSQANAVSATPVDSASPVSEEAAVSETVSTASAVADASEASATSITASQAIAQSIAALKASAASQQTAAPESAAPTSLAVSETAPVESAIASEAESEATPEAKATSESEAVPKSTAPTSEAPQPTDETTDEAPATAAEPTEAQRYDEGLKKSRKTFGDRINAFLANFRHVDESFFDDLEDTLIESDVGYETAMRISDELRDEVKLKNAKSKKEISSVIVEKLVDMYGEAGEGEDNSIHMAASGPTVILFVGVNGAGKTTTIGKMANMYKQQGKKVLLAACDTFRAGAIQQLQVWGQRDGVDVVAGPEKSDPASVCFDAVKKAKAEDYDVLFVDTAGRLQNKVNLMKELEKIKRVITREIPDAPHEVLLVLDATTGQNALTQAKEFKQTTDVSGIVLTKLDGTARGGIVLAIRNELHLAVKYVGLGEKVTDLRPFNANDFVYGLFKDVIAG